MIKSNKWIICIYLNKVNYKIYFYFSFIKSHILAPKIYVACRSADIVRPPLTFDLSGFDISLLKPNGIWTRVEYAESYPNNNN